VYSNTELHDLKNAYAVLNIPYETPAPLIKKAYRALVKKLHPDLFPCGSQEQITATKQIQEINVAYDKIRHAPLRYHIVSYPRIEERRRRQADQNEESAELKDTLPVDDRFEFWFRFVFGCLGGAIIGLPWFFLFAHNDQAVLVGYFFIVICFGCCTVQWGGRFWKLILELWWWVWP